MRATLLLCLYAITLLVPVGLCVDFMVEQERIARELCVQRAVPEEARTCHGQCHLAEQLKQAEGVDDEDAPVPPSFRYEVQFVEERAATRFAPVTSVTVGFGTSDPVATCDGFPRCAEGVPWA